MALNINNTATGSSLDPLKLVKITKDNISDYPGIETKFIGYNLFVNQNHDIASEYKDVLGTQLVDDATGLPSPEKIYLQVSADFGRSKMYINDVQLQNEFESNKTKYDALETSATLDEFRENLSKIFPGISVLDDPSQLEAIYNDALFKKLIPFIYSIYNRFGIRDNSKILEYMAFLQQGSVGSITNLLFPMYSIQPSDDQYVGRLNTSNNPPEPEKINPGDFSGELLDGAMNVSETIKEGKMNAIQINIQLFTSYANINGDAYIFSAMNTITYIAYTADKSYLLMGDTIWRNESVHKAYDLIKEIDTSTEINQRIMWYMYESIFDEYLNPQIQPTLVNIFDLLLKITDLEKRAEIFRKLKQLLNKILASHSSFIPGKLQYLYSSLFDAGSIDMILNAESIAQIEAKLKDFDTCDDADIDSSCKANEVLLPNEPTFFSKITQKVTQRATDVYRGRITPLNKDQAIEIGNSAIMWAIKAYEWSKKNSIAGIQSAVEKIEAIKSKLDASAKQYKEDMTHDTSLYKKYNPIYEEIVAISKKVNTALNFATAVVIIDTLRQAPEGIGSNVKVVNSFVISTLNDIKKMQMANDDKVDAVDSVEADDEREVDDEEEGIVDNGVEEDEEEEVADKEEEVVDNGVEEKKDDEEQVQGFTNFEDMCNNKPKWEEYYKAARPVVNQQIEPDNAWQTEEQSAALCGQHALHNMFRKVWTETACPPKNIRKGVIQNDIYKEHLAADEAAPITTLKQYNEELKGLLENYNRTNEIDLYKICRINRRFILVNDNGTILFRVDPDGCENTGNYSPVIIRNALNIVGYPTFEINNVGDKKYTTEEYCKLIIDQFKSNNNLIGIILHTLKADKDPKNGHFIEVRKNNDDEIEVIDTLYKPNPGSQGESAKLTLTLNGDKDADTLATELNGWIGQAVYKEIYGVIGVFPFSGKYIPARFDQYSDVGALYQKYEETTGHDEIYTDDTGDIFQKMEILFPSDQPTPKSDLIDKCKEADRNFSVETTEVKYVPIYMEDIAVKRGGRRSKKQRGGANPTNIKVESSVKDLYDIAMMLLNLNGELIEKSESQPREQSDQSNLTNTLTILLNTRIPGKRHLLYKPQMTIPNTNSSQVWFDPRIKLKKSIVNKPQPLPPPLPQSQRTPYNPQNRYQMPNGYQRYNQPYNAQNRYQMQNEYQQYNQPYNQPDYNTEVQYGGEGEEKGETPNERKEIYTQFFNRNEFNNLLLRTINESPQQIPDLTTAKEEGITDNNIQITLDTLFKSDNVIYIEGAPYTIYAHDWIIGDWQIDTRPNIYIDSSTRFQLQAPTYTSYGVIIPKTSNIAIFEEAAKKERSEIPITLQRGDALEMSSKINKAIKSVISQVAQNTKPRLTSADIMKKVSPWELAKLLERQMANRAYEPSLDETPNYLNVAPASVVKSANVIAKAEAKAVVEQVIQNIKKRNTNKQVAIDALKEGIKEVANLEEKEAKIEQEVAVLDKEEEILKKEVEKELVDVDNKEESDLDKEAAAAELEKTKLKLQEKLDKMKKGREAKAEITKKKLEQQRKNAMRLNQFNTERRKAAEEQVAVSIPVSSPLLNVDITSQLHSQFENSLIESNNIGFWSDTSTSRYIDNQVPTADAQTQINLWQVDKTGNTLRDVILQIVRNMEKYTTEIENQINIEFNILDIKITEAKQTFIKNQSMDKKEGQPNIYEVYNQSLYQFYQSTILKCEQICKIIKFIFLQYFSFDGNNSSDDSFLKLNQRVDIIPPSENQGIVQNVRGPLKKGVIVKVNDDNTYNVLPDDDKIQIGINNIQPVYDENFVVMNIPNKQDYINANDINLLKNFKKCAFILFDYSGKIENPNFRAIYKQPIFRSRNSENQYIFDLINIPSYLYYMIFLASYKFTEPEDNREEQPEDDQIEDKRIGKFEPNPYSPYLDINILNPTAKSSASKSLNAVYEFYIKEISNKLSGNTSTSFPKLGLPLKMGGSSQSGGGPEDDLVRAIETNNTNQLKTQLKNDVLLINKTDANGNTMLMIACKNKKLGIIKTLLEMGAQGTINKQNAIGDTALHIACKNGYAAIASVLVLNGADLTIKNVLGKTPIEVCDDPALKAMLELHKTNVKKMFEFVKNNRTQDLQQLLKTFRGVNLVDLTTGDTPLHIACQLENKDIALLLIQAGANPTLKNKNDQTPFDLVKNETLKANLQDQYNLTLALFQAVQNNSLPEIKQILDRLPPNQVSIIVNSRTNPESSGQGETPLHIAVKNGNREIVKFLLDNGADVNAGDKYEATPLHFACRNGDGYIARMLVEFGGDLTIKAIDGRTPLDACKTNELRIDLIKDYIEKLARDKKLNLPKGSGLSRSNDEESIKKALAYYLKSPKKIESKNSYYVVMDLDLYPGKSISTAQKARMQCSRVWDNIQEAWADSRGADYIPKEQDISKAPLPVATEVPVAEARPIRRERTRRRYGGKKGGSTRRGVKKGRGSKTRKHKRMKHKSNSRRVKK
jgi:ankyrin repeat protein